MPRKSLWNDIKKKYKIYSDKKFNEIKKNYETPEEFENQVLNNTYFMLIIYLEKNFKLADELALQIKPELKKSVERCTYACRDLLQKHESEGHTKINASILARLLHNSYPELMEFILIAVENPMFFYDKQNKIIALKTTYENECRIANVIKERINNPVNSKMEWEKYSEVGNIKLTKEQLSLLKEINEKSIVMLNGSAGTGKSETVNALIKMLEDNNFSYTLLAPTGIAAKRLRQVTNREANTIHIGFFNY